MFLLGHLGFSALPAAVVAKWWGERRGFRDGVPDLRWLLAGAVLPDVVDKTVGQVLLKPTFENGRIFFHTLLLTLAVLVLGSCRMNRRRDSRLLLLALGMAGHLFLDGIWNEMETFLWPSLGPFLRHPTGKGLLGQIAEYLSDPTFWITETAGLASLVFASYHLGIRSLRELREFLLHGTSPSLVPYAAGY